MNVYDSWLVKQKIAHRGLHNAEAPENTIAAFNNAINTGYAMEIDVHMTTDEVLVVFHDDNMKRLTGYDKDIRECSYDEIKNLTILNSQEKIPTFEQFLTFVAGRQPVLIEVKDHKNVGTTEQKIADALANYKGEFALQSFNPFIVKWFADNTPQYLRGQLSSAFKDNKTLAWYKKVLLKNLAFIKYNHSQFVSYDIEDISVRFILRLKKKMPILAWTVRTQQEIELKCNYFDNIIFESFIPQ